MFSSTRFNEFIEFPVIHVCGNLMRKFHVIVKSKHEIRESLHGKILQSPVAKPTLQWLIRTVAQN